MATALIRGLDDLRRTINSWRQQGQRIALVPTMGALHEGHLSLMRLAAQHSDRVCASIFVNPTQFGPNEDFEAYPRDLDRDYALLEKEEVDLLYAPETSDIYCEGFATSVRVSGVSEGLCGGNRPGHFDGVALIVTKLLLRVLPDLAVFGEKDYQQLQVIRRLVRDLDIPVEILGGPTIRETDGLALSSRNAYLNPTERAIAPALYRVLTDYAQKLSTGAPTDLNEACSELIAAGFNRVEYLEWRSSEGLHPPAPGREPGQIPGRLLAAAHLRSTRLIDNVPVLPLADRD